MHCVVHSTENPPPHHVSGHVESYSCPTDIPDHDQTCTPGQAPHPGALISYIMPYLQPESRVLLCRAFPTGSPRHTLPAAQVMVRLQPGYVVQPVNLNMSCEPFRACPTCSTQHGPPAAQTMSHLPSRSCPIYRSDDDSLKILSSVTCSLGHDPAAA